MIKRIALATVAGMLLLAPAAAQTSGNGLRFVALGYCQLTGITNTAAVALSSCAGGIPATANRVQIVAEGQAIRYRDDGTAPTATVGMPLAVNLLPFEYAGPISKLQFIGQTTGATVNVLFSR